MTRVFKRWKSQTWRCEVEVEFGVIGLLEVRHEPRNVRKL